ncbi:MAG TPA: hypothetical protein VNO24_21025 [Blastocatellia bacterium]|nr:hypothetical protein [Blastocatellia bacterium]
MEKTRRIEITAFRRTTRISSETPEIKVSEEFSQNQTHGLPSTDDDPARIESLDVFEGPLSLVGDPGSSEFPQLIEELVVGAGDVACAAQQRGWRSNRIYSKLRSLRHSMKNLRANGNRISDKRT